MRGVLSAIEKDGQKLVEKARNIPSMTGLDLASRVTTPHSYHWTQTVEPCSPSELLTAHTGPRFNVVAYDFGIKQNILRRLVHSGCNVTVVACAHFRRRRSRAQARWHLPFERTRRPRTPAHTNRQRAPPHRQSSDLRHLPRPPDSGARRRRQNLQTESRPSRRQSSGHQQGDPARRNHVAQSRLASQSIPIRSTITMSTSPTSI